MFKSFLKNLFDKDATALEKKTVRQHGNMVFLANSDRATLRVHDERKPGGLFLTNGWEATQWSKTFDPAIEIANGSFIDLLSLLDASNKASISSTNIYQLDINEEDAIKINWLEVPEKLTFRINLEVTQNGTDYYLVQLRRNSNHSIISSIPFSINAQDAPDNNISITTTSYVLNENDPFVTDGFYIALQNNSGQVVDVSAVNILIFREMGA